MNTCNWNSYTVNNIFILHIFIMKKFILSLLFTIFWLISFSNAWSVSYNFIIPAWTYNWNVKLFWWPLPLQDLSLWFNLKCVFTWIDWTYSDWNKSFSLDADKITLNSRNYSSISLSSVSFSKFFSNTTYTLERTYSYSAWDYNYYSSFYFTDPYQGVFTLNSNLYISCTISWDNVIWGSCPECETCPEVDTGEILSGYIAIEDVTTNYCVSNDLCPEMSWWNSAIYINDIRHESMPFINIRIPEEIERNYEYTGNNTQLDISVEWYWYDQEKMQNMINTQYYTPTSEEMSNLIWKIADFLPLIAIALLIVRIRRVLKKVFRL